MFSMFSMCLCVLYFSQNSKLKTQNSQNSQKCIKTMFPMCHFDKLSASLCVLYFSQNSKFTKVH